MGGRSGITAALRDHRAPLIIGGLLATAAALLALIALMAWPNAFADSNNPGVINSATYDSAAQTLMVNATSNCVNNQPMGIAFFAVSKNPTTGAAEFPHPGRHNRLPHE